MHTETADADETFYIIKHSTSHAALNFDEISYIFMQKHKGAHCVSTTKFLVYKFGVKYSHVKSIKLLSIL